jgi:hypothetical protein
VRDDEPEPNGVPNDLSYLAQWEIYKWGQDGHSHCHFSVEEFCKRWLIANGKQQEYIENKLEGKDNAIARAARELFALSAYSEEPDYYKNYRVIVWFDN